jgi:hypothetical protein
LETLVRPESPPAPPISPAPALTRAPTRAPAVLKFPPPPFQRTRVLLVAVHPPPPRVHRRAVERGLTQALVDHVVHPTHPLRQGHSRGRVWRVPLHHLGEVARAHASPQSPGPAFTFISYQRLKAIDLKRVSRPHLATFSIPVLCGSAMKS